MYESDDKMVSHPDHYQTSSGLEAIDVIEAFTEDLKGIEATDTGNILKYAMRWNKKNGKRDIEKIIWYATHLLEHLKKKEETLAVYSGNGEKVAEIKASKPHYDADSATYSLGN